MKKPETKIEHIDLTLNEINKFKNVISNLKTGNCNENKYSSLDVEHFIDRTAHIFFNSSTVPKLYIYNKNFKYKPDIMLDSLSYDLDTLEINLYSLRVSELEREKLLEFKFLYELSKIEAKNKDDQILLNKLNELNVSNENQKSTFKTLILENGLDIAKSLLLKVIGI